MSDGKTLADGIAAMTFEAAMKELEVIVNRLESGEAPLEDSIALYERGAALRAHCEGKLKDAEMRVEKITQGAAGPTASPFDAGAPKPGPAPAPAAPQARPQFGADRDDEIPF